MSTSNLNGIQFMTKAQYDAVGSKDAGTIYCVETPVVIESYHNGNSGYKVWSDGFIEQWGETSSSVGDTVRTIQLPIPFTTTTYFVAPTGGIGGSTSAFYNQFQLTARTLTNFNVKAGCLESIICNWYACGY